MIRSQRRAFVAAALAVAAGAFALPVQAQSKPPIKIGVISPLTGPVTTHGKSQEMIVKLAAEDINAAGGINGSPLQVDVVDSSVDPGQAVLLFRKFFNDGYFGVIGPMTGTQWETVAPLANQLNMPAISVNAIKPGITVRPWTLRLQPPDDTLMPDGMKAFLKAFPNIKKVVIAADVREASSKAAADAFAVLAKEANIEVLGTVEFSSRATDLSAVALEIKSKNPDAILAGAFINQAALLAKDLTLQGVNVPVLNTSLLWTGPYINVAGENGKNWHVIGFSTNASGPEGNYNKDVYDKLSKRVQDRTNDTLGKPFNLANWPVTYDGVMFYADVLRRAGIDGNTDPKKARETIKDAFMNTKEFSAGALKYTIRDTGDGYIPGTALAPDIQNKVWTFMPAK